MRVPIIELTPRITLSGDDTNTDLRVYYSSIGKGQILFESSAAPDLEQTDRKERFPCYLAFMLLVQEADQ